MDNLWAMSQWEPDTFNEIVSGGVCFVLELDSYSSSSQKQHTPGRHVAPLGQIILIPRLPILALYSMLLHA
jgi:hypothetical protein